MTRWMMFLVVIFAGGRCLLAQEPEAFVPPQAYPVERYEAAWSKNPFTLKTAPAVVENVSAAKDLAIGSHYGNKDNPTVVVVNTKTHERIRLKKGETASNGMKLNSVKLGATRKETTVEITLGSETAELTYNAEYMNQMASSAAAKATSPQAQQQMILQQQQQQQLQQRQSMPAGMQPPRPPQGMPPKVQLPTGNAGMARPANAALQGGQFNMASSGGQQPGGNNINLSIPNGGVPPQQGAGSLVSQNNSPPPLPPRRRIIQ